MMKKIVLSTIAAIGLSTSALAADLPVKARPVVAAPPSAWDIAFGAAIMNDYIFRGITQSNRKPSVAAYFEPRYNLNADWQLYVGIAGESISFPNRAAAEIDLYGGIRPTFGKLALDFGVWYYWYPGGQCFHPTCPNGALLNGNVIKADVSFIEFFGKATYNITDALAIGGSVFYSPSVLHSGANGLYLSVNGKYTLPAWGAITPSISAELGFWNFGTSDAFYAVAGFPGGIPYKDYAHWNIGVAFAYKVFTLDLRYHDTNLNRGDCNAFTSDHTATGVFTTNINPGGPGSKWCGAAFVAKLSADLTANTNLK
jgi:uncharacterized protein (TIGR02001 family)